MRKNLKLGLGALACACLALTSAQAIPYNLTVDGHLPPGTTQYVLGAVDPAVPASDAADVSYINAILGLSLGATGQVPGSGNNVDYIYRSLNTFGSLPQATTVGDMSGGSDSFTLTSGYVYLAAKYAGGNGAGGGLEIWDIASILSGNTINIPEYAFGTGNDQYQLSGWELLDVTGSNQNVPDGASTVLLLGIALLAAGLVGRYLAVQSKQA